MTRLLSSTLAEAEKSQALFTWFCFEKVDEPAPAGALVFRPNGPAFHSRVKLILGLSAGVIRSAELHVRRSFIEDPAQGAFAADLAKSFIACGDGAPQLAEEIQSRAMTRSARPVIMRGELPRAAGPVSEAFRVYEGGGAQAQTGDVRIENRTEDGERVLVISIGHEGKPQGWFARLFQRAR